VGTNPSHLRTLINDRLEFLSNPEFEMSPRRNMDWSHRMTALYREKRNFFDKYGYDWAIEPDAYNSPFEMFLQWRILNVLSDVSSNHPALDRCSNLVVRLVPTSSARPHLRLVEHFRVIILTSGYLSAFKGFMRLWLRGCALGQTKPMKATGLDRPDTAGYLSALENHEGPMSLSAKAYVGTLAQLLNNKPPIMDESSIFDDEVLKRDQWQQPFGILSNAIDGFLLFHEVAHVLAGDSPTTERTIESELGADIGSVSLCIIDQARNGGIGTLYLGAPMFFCVELLRLLCEEIVELAEGRHNLAKGRYPGINELMMRSGKYQRHLQRYLGPLFDSMYNDWVVAMGCVFDTVRWAFLHSTGAQTSLPQFVLSRHKKT
jgi:hypothetical protein